MIPSPTVDSELLLADLDALAQLSAVNPMAWYNDATRKVGRTRKRVGR
jgi:hypothetical protein